MLVFCEVAVAEGAGADDVGDAFFCEAFACVEVDVEAVAGVEGLTGEAALLV